MSDEPFRVDGLEPEYRLGDVIAGRVLLADSERATVGLVFETSGRCDTERAVLREIEIGPGSGWTPFTLDGPRWPPTYRGSLFSGDWFLEFSQLSRGEWATSRHVLDVSQGTPVAVTSANATSTSRAPSGRGLGTRLAVLLGLEAACIALIIAGGVGGSRWWIAGLVGAIVLLLPTVGTTLGVLPRRATRGMHVVVDPQARGLAVRAEFGTADVVEEVTAALVVREMVQQYTGTDRPDRREQEIHRQEVTLVRRDDRSFGSLLPVPADQTVPPTFSHSTAQVGWSLHVTAKLRGAPDIARTVPLVARPPAGPGSEITPRWTVG